jgi:hypothetical protein
MLFLSGRKLRVTIAPQQLPMNFGLAALQEVFEHGILEGMSEVLYIKEPAFFLSSFSFLPQQRSSVRCV